MGDTLRCKFLHSIFVFSSKLGLQNLQSLFDSRTQQKKEVLSVAQSLEHGLLNFKKSFPRENNSSIRDVCCFKTCITYFLSP